jgi:hypothetical protein
MDIYYLMAPFKPADLDSSLSAKRKRTINPKLLDDNNMSLDAIKRRKMELSSSTLPSLPKNSRFILESTDDDNDNDDEDSTHLAHKKTLHTKQRHSIMPKTRQSALREKSDDEELSESSILTPNKQI